MIGGKRTYDTTPVDAFFSGLMDDVRIYDRAVSPAEILRIMHAH